MGLRSLMGLRSRSLKTTLTEKEASAPSFPPSTRPGSAPPGTGSPSPHFFFSKAKPLPPFAALLALVFCLCTSFVSILTLFEQSLLSGFFSKAILYAWRASSVLFRVF